jgi:IS5 family transposase
LLFRDHLAQAGFGTKLFDQLEPRWIAYDYFARCGQIIDASLVQAPAQRNKCDEAETVKERTMPIACMPHKRAQKDVGAKWTKKYGRSHFGYKLHASNGKRHQLVRKVIMINAAVSDTLVFKELLDPTYTSRNVYADRGYPSAEREATLTAAGWRVQIQHKGSANKPFYDTQKQCNRLIATLRHATPRHAHALNTCLTAILYERTSRATKK